MNANDYESIWQRQTLPDGAGVDLPALRRTFEAKRRKLARVLMVRDLVEASAGILVALFFAYRGWVMGPAGWPIALSVALLLGVAVFFLRERLRTRREKLGPDATLLAKLEGDLAELRHQRRLLLNVTTWYLTPCLASLVIFAATLGAFTLPTLARDWLFQLGYWTFVLFLYWRIRGLNHRVVRTQIEPRLAELEELRRDLLSQT